MYLKILLVPKIKKEKLLIKIYMIILNLKNPNNLKIIVKI